MLSATRGSDVPFYSPKCVRLGFSEIVAEDATLSVQGRLRRGVRAEFYLQLQGRPFRGWMRGAGGVKDIPALVGRVSKGAQNLNADSRHSEKGHRNATL
jgi:hypothetical protein